jgi:hypothetical protein
MKFLLFFTLIQFSYIAGIAQHINGCYLAAYLGGGAYDASYIAPTEFNALVRSPGCSSLAMGK